METVTAYRNWNNDSNKFENTEHELLLATENINISLPFTVEKLISNKRIGRLNRNDGPKYHVKIRYYFNNPTGTMGCDVTELLDTSVISCDEKNPNSTLIPIDKLCDGRLDCETTHFDESPDKCKGTNEMFRAAIWISTFVIIALGND